MLQILLLDSNQMGNAGATSIGGALTYVYSRYRTFSVLSLYILSGHATCFFGLNGPYQNVYVSDLQPKQDIANAGS
jgi:hypothetical protein